MSNLTSSGENPLQMFLYALRAPESKRQAPRKLKLFLEYLTNKGELNTNQSLDSQSREFLIKTKENPTWANSQLMQFILYQKSRAEKAEIVFTTIRNYLEAIKLFLEMNCDIPLVNWKRIIKGGDLRQSNGECKKKLNIQLIHYSRKKVVTEKLNKRPYSIILAAGKNSEKPSH